MENSSQVSRRGFVTGTGALGLGLVASGGLLIVREPEAQAAPKLIAGKTVDAWVSIFPDDRVTIRFAAAEMGQGVNTALPMILAEELDVDWNKVSAEQVSSDPDGMFGNPSFSGNLFTAGSASIEGYFMPLRRVGAQARQVLLQRAAAHWGVPVEELITEPSAVLHDGSGRRMTYGDVAALPILSMEVPQVTNIPLKPREKWRIIGTNLKRLDIPAKTRGEPICSIDVRLPGMLYATQLSAPVEGERPLSISDDAARKVTGVVDIVLLDNSVAVLASTWEAALEARDLLEVSWSEDSPFRRADSREEFLEISAAASDLSRPSTAWSTRGSPNAFFNGEGSKVISSLYTTEYAYHAQMEPLNALASVDPDGKGAEIWLGTQSQSVTIGVAANTLGTTADRIKLHAMQMGGGFGRRTVFARELLRDALLLSRKSKRPIKLMWTREDDVKQGWYRPPTAHRLDAVIDQDGELVAMRHRIAGPSILAFAPPRRWESSNGKDSLVMESAEASFYAIPNHVSEHVVTDRRARISAWRGIGWGPTAFARECFIDELAEAANSEPLAFRQRLLRENPRGLAVLDEAARMSDYGRPLEGRAHGLAFAPYKTTLGAAVAEVTGENDGFRVLRVWAAIDAGVIIHPQNYMAQVKGGIVFALSSLLNERVTIRGGEVQSSNFHDYEIMRADQAPEVQIKLIESAAAPSGGGEIGVPMTGAAVGNALRRLRGIGPKSLPFSAS